MSPLIVVVVAFFSTATAHAIGDTVAGAKLVDEAAQHIYNEIPIWCAASDVTIDGLSDLIDQTRKKNQKIKITQRIRVDAVAAADAICAASAAPDTFANRLKLIVKAMEAIMKANKALNLTKPIPKK